MEKGIDRRSKGDRVKCGINHSKNIEEGIRRGVKGVLRGTMHRKTGK